MISSLSLIPSIWVRWAILAALWAASVGFGYVHGLTHEKATWQAADALRERQDGAHLLIDTQHARDAEQKLRDSFDKADTKRQEDKDVHEKELDKLRASVRAGTERLRCPGAKIPASAAPDNSATASGPSNEGRSGDLVPQAAVDILGIGARIRGLVRERNDLIDKYNAARETCNGGSQ